MLDCSRSLNCQPAQPQSCTYIVRWQQRVSVLPVLSHTVHQTATTTRNSEISLPKSHCRAMAARQEPLKRCSSGTLHQRNLRLCISDYSGYVKHQLKSLSLNVGCDHRVSYHHLTAVWFNVR